MVKEKINSINKIVNYLYENDVKGVKILQIEQEFDKYFGEVGEIGELEVDEQQEILCLEYEYEAKYTYKYQPNEILCANLLFSFCDVAKSIYEHNRMQKVVSRIFQVDEELIIKQKNIFLDFGEELNVQRGWFLEAYGDEYKARGKYKDAQTCYWEALDEYMYINESKKEEIGKYFYDGQALLYMCDVIYRIYECVRLSGDYEFAEYIFKIHEEKFKEVDYFNMYYAIVLYNFAHLNGNNQLFYLEKAISVIRNIKDELYSVECFEILCGALFELQRYEECISICKKASSYGFNIKELADVLKFLIISNIHLVSINLKMDNDSFKKHMEEIQEYFPYVPIDKMDGFKKYLSVIKWYNNSNISIDNKIELSRLLFLLMEKVEDIKGGLQYKKIDNAIGYYTTLESLSYLLEDETTNLKQRIAVFDARHMNDPNEGRVLLEYLNKEIDNDASKSSYIRKEYDKNYVFLKSFTTKVDSLPMWVQYGQDGAGCFVSIDQKMFKEGQNLVYSKTDKGIREMQNEDDYQLYRIAYFDGAKFVTFDNIDITSQIEDIREVYKKIISYCYEYSLSYSSTSRVVDDVLSRIKYLVKKDDYKNEDEVRVLFFRTGKECDIEHTNMGKNQLPKLFIRMKVSAKIKEIILGPKVMNGENQVPYIYKKLGTDNVLVSQSSIDYV